MSPRNTLIELRSYEITASSRDATLRRCLSGVGVQNISTTPKIARPYANSVMAPNCILPLQFDHGRQVHPEASSDTP